MTSLSLASPRVGEGVKSAWAHRRSAVFAALVGLFAGCLVLDSYSVGVFHDDAMYVVLARALATGQGYHYINLPDAPFASHFPPAYPALLSLIWRAMPDFPANVVAFKLLNVALLSVTALYAALIARDVTDSDSFGAAVGLATAVSVPLLVLVSMVLSEPLFLALVLAILYRTQQLLTGEPAILRAVQIGALAGMAMLVRAHGIVLLPAVALPLLMHRRWRESISVLSAAAIVVIPWQLWSAAHATQLAAPLQGNYGSYIGWWMRGYDAMGPEIVRRTLMKTIPETTSMMIALFSPVRGGIAHSVTAVALAIATGVGSVFVARKAPAMLLFLAGYLGIVLLWPFAPTRFIWGVWPLVLLVLACAASRARTHIGTPILRRPVTVAAVAWLAIGFASYEVRAVRGRWWESVPRTGSVRVDAAVAWVNRNSAPGDVIAADDEGAVFLYTGRHALPVASFTTDDYLGYRSSAIEAREGLLPLLARYPVAFVIAESQRTVDAAMFLTSGPTPMLSLREQLPAAAAFNVIRR